MLTFLWTAVPMAVLEDQVLRIANATTHEMIEECKADVQKSVLAATQLAKGLNRIVKDYASHCLIPYRKI